MSAKFPIALQASTVVSSSGTGATFDLEADDTTARLWLEVTAASGTAPTLLVTVEHSHNGVTWDTLGTFAQKTAPGAEYKAFPDARQFVRVRWTVGGTTPSFTFGVAGEQVYVYATPEDVKLLGLRGVAMQGDDAITDQEIDEAAEAAGDLLDSYANTADLSVPFLEWPDSWRRAAAIVIGYDLISARIGYNPSADGDDPFRKRYEDVIRWLEGIADGSVLLPGTTTPPGATTVGRVLVITAEPARGWDD